MLKMVIIVLFMVSLVSALLLGVARLNTGERALKALKTLSFILLTLTLAAGIISLIVFLF